MPRRYEEEINEILGKYDWPADGRARRARAEPPRPAEPRVGVGEFFAHFGPQQIMASGLVLILVGIVLRFADRFAFGLDLLGMYATAIGVLVLLFGYILAVIRGGGGPVVGGRRQTIWRGRVVDLRPSNRGLGYWLWRWRANLLRRRS
jgi:hypothetical protein